MQDSPSSEALSSPIRVPLKSIAPVPRISIQAFCETPEVAEIITAAADERHISKAYIKVHMGGASGAVESYRNAPTPNLVVIEATGESAFLMEQLDELAEYCDAGTKVIVVGYVNDITLYRDLLARGVSDYLVMPFGVLDFVQAVSSIYTLPGADVVGRIIAVTGAKGGVGASTVAHNLAWTMAQGLDISTVIVDMDLGFGTAGLDFNQDPPQGIAEAVFASDRLDMNVVDRLLSKCGQKLNLLAAPALLDRVYDFNEETFDNLIELLRSSIPLILLDIPHQWTAWVKRVLLNADDIVLVASPDLANLRNTKNIMDSLRMGRAHDHHPHLIINGVGMPRRPEISIADFTSAIEMKPVSVIPFEPKLFGTAANNGQMIAEVDPNHKVSDLFNKVAKELTGRNDFKKSNISFSDNIKSWFSWFS